MTPQFRRAERAEEGEGGRKHAHYLRHADGRRHASAAPTSRYSMLRAGQSSTGNEEEGNSVCLDFPRGVKLKCLSASQGQFTCIALNYLPLHFPLGSLVSPPLSRRQSLRRRRPSRRARAGGKARSWNGMGKEKDRKASQALRPAPAAGYTTISMNQEQCMEGRSTNLLSQPSIVIA